jgi:hypothetical protein
MTIEQAIVQKLFIQRIGQLVSFQVRLPRNTKRLIGLEYDARKIAGNGYVSRLQYGWEGDTSFKRYKNKTIGKLSLYNNSCEGLFYEGDLIEDRNKWQYEGYWHGSNVEVWMQSTRREEIGLSVTPGLIQGLYQDQYGVNEYVDLMYELCLYFWIEKCNP